ncbi:hypothetical protein RMATCC62417_11728 [Rhizopus microsporus]|nr:hypothetical protein RMATCC62417_11728 [Rhizopus microsporus]
MESEHNVQPNQSLPPEQIEELYQQSAARFRIEEDEQRKHHQLTLPEAIQTDMEDTPKAELKAKIKKFQRKTVNYEGENWTRSGAINTIFLAYLKKFNLDTYTVADYKHKDAERLRAAGKATAEIFHDLVCLRSRRIRGKFPTIVGDP